MKVSKSSGTALWAVGFLFFLQLYTLYVESIYRMSLIKLSMGAEMLGILFLLAPLVVLAIGRRGERGVVPAAIGGLVVARCVAPYLGARGQIACAGLGVACFLLLMCYVFAGSRAVPDGDWTAAAAVAVLCGIALRNSWWVTLDWSMERGTLAPTALVLATIPVSAWWTHRRNRTSLAENERSANDGGHGPSSFGRCMFGALVFFTSMTLVYLVVIGPGVTSAWSGGSYWAAIVLVTLSWIVALYVPRPRRKVLAAWNASFVGLLVWGILANRTAFPGAPDAVAVVAGYSGWAQHVPIYAALLLSPVLAYNVDAALGVSRAMSPRKSAMAVFVGGVTMFAVTLLLIFTSVWGYVAPLSGLMRNKFYLPFVLVGAVMTVGHVLLGGTARPSALAADTARRWARSVGGVLGGVFLAWFCVDSATSVRELVRTDDSRTHEMRVLTYNMQQGTELDGDQAYLAQMRFIAGIDADLVLLQESDTARPSGGNVDAPRLFADALGYHLYYGPKSVSGTFGTAILSRYPLENVRTIFTYSDVDEVGTAVAEIVVGGRRIGIFNNHPAGSDAVKHAHVDALIASAKDYEHAIAAGDFNFRQDSPYYAKVALVLKDTWLALHPNAVGDAQSVLGGDESDTNRFDMQRRIDHVFITDDATVVEAQYILTPDSMTDHPAYWCMIRW